MKKTPHLVIAGLLGLALLTPAARALGDGNDCSTGTKGYTLTMESTVGLGEWFLTCLQTPPRSMVFIMISDGTGPLETQYGPLCLDFPFITVWPVVVPEDGCICLEHYVHCEPELDGFVGYFQFAGFGPEPWMAGLSNMESLTAVDTGTCIPPGDFYSWTQGAWGGKCAGQDVACVRDANFDLVFPNDLFLGDQDGIDGDGHYALALTSSKAVQDFLPTGGTTGVLDQDCLNPTGQTSAGVLAGHLAAAKLNVGFDDAGVFDAFKNQTAVKLGDLLFSKAVHEKLLDRSVREVLALCDKAMSCELVEPIDVDGDLVGDVYCSDLQVAVVIVNENFDEGLVNEGYLKLP